VAQQRDQGWDVGGMPGAYLPVDQVGDLAGELIYDAEESRRVMRAGTG